APAPAEAACTSRHHESSAWFPRNPSCLAGAHRKKAALPDGPIDPFDTAEPAQATNLVRRDTAEGRLEGRKPLLSAELQFATRRRCTAPGPAPEPPPALCLLPLRDRMDAPSPAAENRRSTTRSARRVSAHAGGTAGETRRLRLPPPRASAD